MQASLIDKTDELVRCAAGQRPRNPPAGACSKCNYLERQQLKDYLFLILPQTGQHREIFKCGRIAFDLTAARQFTQ